MSVNFQTGSVYIFVVFLVLFVWLIFLTVLYVKSVSHYNKLFVDDEKSLKEAINTIFSGLKELYEKYSSSADEISELKKDSLKHIKKVAIKRFNPFDDTGGNQSFSATMLDANNDGIVFSSLHGRSGTRIYGKPVKSRGQSGYELSKEEQDIISLAIKGDSDGK